MFRKVYIEITNVCNLKCKFCPETSRTKRFMSVEDFRYIISKIHKYTELNIPYPLNGVPQTTKEQLIEAKYSILKGIKETRNKGD